MRSFTPFRPSFSSRSRTFLRRTEGAHPICRQDLRDTYIHACPWHRCCCCCCCSSTSLITRPGNERFQVPADGIIPRLQRIYITLRHTRLIRSCSVLFGTLASRGGIGMSNFQRVNLFTAAHFRNEPSVQTARYSTVIRCDWLSTKRVFGDLILFLEIEKMRWN